MQSNDHDLVPAWLDGQLRPVPKLEAHVRGLRHKAVSVFVLDGSRVLIQKRAAGKYHTPGLWGNTCCTHPRWGESPADCAIRRLAEEVGIMGLPLMPVGQVEYRADVGGGMVEHEVVDIFVGQANADLATTPAPSEVEALRWIDLAALEAEIAAHPARFTPWLKIYLSDHRKVILGA